MSTKAIELLQQAEKYSSEEEWEQAISACERALNYCKYELMLKKTTEGTPKKYLTLGEELEHQGERATAIACYRKAIELNPKLVKAYQNLGRVLKQDKNWEEAVYYLEKALAIQTEKAQTSEKTGERSFEEYKQQGNILAEQGKAEAAITFYKKALSVQPDAADVHSNIGSLYAKNQKWGEAIEWYQKALKLNPNFAGAYRNLTRVLSKTGQEKAAAECWYKALTLEPNWANEQEYINLGDRFKEHLRLDLAKDCYERSLKVKPNFAPAYQGMAELAAKQEKWEEAIGYYQTLIKLQPENWQAYIELGKALEKREKIEEAVTVLERAITLNSQAEESYYQLGIILAGQGKDEQAIEYLTKVTQLNPKAARGYYQLAKVLRKKSRYNEAIDCYLKTLELEPEFQLAYIDLQYTRIESDVQLEKIISFYRQVIKEKDLPIAWGNLGDALTEQGKIEEAIKCYRTSSYKQTVATNPHLAKIQWKEKKELPPDFIIIGGGKCGTTSLYQYLGNHPRMLLPHKKELNFFTKNFQYGVNWYLAQFPAITDRPKFLTGEASTSYLDLPMAAKRIFQLFPEIKLIVLLRNPRERAVSWHYQVRNLGIEQKPLATAIAEEMEFIEELSESELMKMGRKPPNNLLGSLYIYKLRRWLKLFKREQLLILQSEELYNNPAQVMEQVFNFLGMQPHQEIEYTKYNTGDYPEISEELKQKLSEYFRPYNQKLEEEIGVKFNWD